MTGELITAKSGLSKTVAGAAGMPALIRRAGAGAEKRFLEFFAAQIRNRNTREAYLRAVRDFLGWAEIEAGIGDLLDIEPVHVAAWVELKTRAYGAQSVKQQLAALRHLFDWLVTGHVLHTNPASFVRGPKFSYTKGKTPILTPNEARKLIRAIPADTVVGLRDRALIGLMIYTFARVSAAVNMNVKDVYQKQETLWVRLHEKGGKHHEMPCQHNLKDWLRAYIEAAGIAEERKAPSSARWTARPRRSVKTASTDSAPGRWSSGGHSRPGSRRPASAITPSGAPASPPISKIPRPSWSTPSRWPRTRTRRRHGSMTGGATRSRFMRWRELGFEEGGWRC
jgi:site-specific recombinase XerD